jgi:DNA-binding NarL/FixJ family response regulator
MLALGSTQLDALPRHDREGGLWWEGRSGSRARAIAFEANRSHVRFLLDWRHLLKGRQKRVFNMRFNEGLSFKQIGKRLGIRKSTACVYVRRAALRIHALWLLERARLAAEAARQEQAFERALRDARGKVSHERN